MAVSDPEPGAYSVPSPALNESAAGPDAAPARTQAMQRFLACRWKKAAEAGVPDHCTHRDVQPMAGTAGFTPDSWCADCGHFKIRRTPRKRPLPGPEDRYYY